MRMTEMINEKLIRRPEILLAASTILLFLPFEWTMAAGAVILITAALKGKLIPAIRRQPGTVWVYSLAALQLFSALRMENTLGVLNALGTFAVAMLVGLFAKSFRPSALHLCLKTIVILSCLMAVFGIAEFAHSVSIQNLDFWQSLAEVPESCRIRTVYFNPNLYAAMIVSFLILCMYLFLENPGWKRKTFYFSAALLNLTALIMTGSRGAMLALPAAVPLFLLFSKRKSLLKLCLGAEGGLIGLIMLHPGIIPRFDQMISINSRLDIWRSALQQLKYHWLVGGGPQYYQMLSGRLPIRKAAHAHNILLDSLLNSGVIGTLLCFGYIQKLYKMGMNQRIDRDIPLYRPLMLALLAAIGIQGMVDCTINFPATGLLVLSILNVPAYLEKQTAVQPAFSLSRYMDALAQEAYRMRLNAALSLTPAAMIQADRVEQSLLKGGYPSGFYARPYYEMYENDRGEKTMLTATSARGSPYSSPYRSPYF